MNTSAVVTGAGRGIGRAIAERLVGLGHAVVITDVDEQQVRRTAPEIGAVAGLCQDVRDADSHHVLADAALEHGPLRVWVNNAGVGYDGTLAELDADRLRALVEINELGVIWGCRAALAAFGEEGGDIVNVASLSGHGPVPGLSVYAATKAAVVSLTLSLSWELDPPVRAHAVCPDGVATAMVDAMRPDGTAKRLVASGGRLLRPGDVADAAVGLIGTDRVVRTLPGWRGGLLRLAALTPTASRRLVPLMLARGRRALGGG